MLYTLGGLENLQTAKKYYASTINLSGGKNTRALYGVCLVSRPSSWSLILGFRFFELKSLRLVSLHSSVLHRHQSGQQGAKQGRGEFGVANPCRRIFAQGLQAARTWETTAPYRDIEKYEAHCLTTYFYVILESLLPLREYEETAYQILQQWWGFLFVAGLVCINYWYKSLNKIRNMRR